MSKILKNQTASAVSISDVGQTVPASGQLTVNPQDFDLYSASNDLVLLIGDGTLIVNDGSFDLDKSDGIRLIQGGFSNKIQVDDDLLSSDRLKVDVTGTLGNGQVSVSANDSTTAFLADKIVSADNKLTISELNDGGDEDLQIQVVPGNIGTSELNNDANFIDSSGAPVQPGDIANFETSTQLDARDTANRDRANHTGTQTASTISDFAAQVAADETTTSLSFNAGTNILSFTDEDGGVTNIDLSLYLDDTNLSRITGGVLDSGTGICTFTRDDNSTFTVDFSSLNDQAFINAAIATHETTIANHDDVNLSGQADGDFLRRVGGVYTPYNEYKVHILDTTAEATQLTAFQQKTRLNYTIPVAGEYKISVDYIWSLNITTSDFEARLQIDDTTTIFEHRQEPKDSAGTGITVPLIEGGTVNTGTDQKHVASFAQVISLSAGAGFIDLDFRNTVGGTEAAIHRASIILERF